MDIRKIAETWRVNWPKAIPSGEYETALMFASLIGTIGSASPKAKTESKATVTVEPTVGLGERLLTVEEAAKVLGLSPNGVDYHVRVGNLKFIRRKADGRIYRMFRPKDVEAIKARARNRPKKNREEDQSTLKLVKSGEAS